MTDRSSDKLAVFVVCETGRLLAWAAVAVQLWEWFVIPIFTSLPTVPLIHACGIMLLIQLLTFRDHYRPIRTVRDTALIYFGLPIVAITAGFCLTLWI